MTHDERDDPPLFADLAKTSCGLWQAMPQDPPDYGAMPRVPDLEAAHRYMVTKLAGAGTTLNAWHAGLMAQLGQEQGKGDGMQDFAVPNQLKGRTEFRGIELAHSDSRRQGADPARWVELTLWKTEAGAYVLRRVGKSRVFHVYDGDCDRGVKTKVSELDADAIACVDCRPVRVGNRPDRWYVDMEQDRPEVTDHVLPADVIAALTTTRREGGAPFLSQPALRLLEFASEADDGIRVALAASVTRIA